MADQEWFPYNSDESKIMVLPAKSPLVHRSASGTEVREGGRPKVRPS